MSRKNGAGVIRVLVVASSSVRRAGLEALVKTSAPLKLAGSTPSLAVVPAQAREFQPDIILADLDRTDPQFVTTISALTESARNIGGWHWSTTRIPAGRRGLCVPESKPFCRETHLRSRSYRLYK